MKVLLSIKPKYAYKIFDGTKKYEFRRTIFKNKKVTKIIVYASAPVSKVIGEFDIETVLQEKIGKLWQETKKYSGITEDFYYSYFKGKDMGFAIKIKQAKRYKKDYCIQEKFGVKPPQSFRYINELNKKKEVKA